MPLDQYTRNSIAQVAEIIGEALDEPFLPAAPAERQCAWCDYQPICSKADRAGSVRRVPATDVELLVIKSVRKHLKPSQPIDDRSLIHARVTRVEVQPKQLVIRLAEEKNATANRKKTRVNGALHIPWQRTPSTRRREFILPEGMSPQHARPIRSERARHWWQLLPEDVVGLMNSQMIQQ